MQTEVSGWLWCIFYWRQVADEVLVQDIHCLVAANCDSGRLLDHGHQLGMGGSAGLTEANGTPWIPDKQRPQEPCATVKY